MNSFMKLSLIFHDTSLFLEFFSNRSFLITRLYDVTNERTLLMTSDERNLRLQLLRQAVLLKLQPFVLRFQDGKLRVDVRGLRRILLIHLVKASCGKRLSQSEPFLRVPVF